VMYVNVLFEFDSIWVDNNAFFLVDGRPRRTKSTTEVNTHEPCAFQSIKAFFTIKPKSAIFLTDLSERRALGGGGKCKRCSFHFS